MKEALAEIQRERGRQFDPEIVDAFMRVQAWESGRGERAAKAREDREEEQEVLASVTSLVDRRMGIAGTFAAGSSAGKRGDTVS